MNIITARLVSLACLLAMAAQVRGQGLFELETNAYRDYHITLQAAPEFHYGSVYVTKVHEYASREQEITLRSEPGPTAELKANIIADAYQGFGCQLRAYPRAGYTLDGFVRIENYRPGEEMSAHYLEMMPGRRLRSGETYYIEKPEKSELRTSDPTMAKGYRFNAKRRVDIIAVFREAVSKKIEVDGPGQLAETIERQEAQEADNLVVSGPINATDIECLHQLSKAHNLARLDLSNARIEEIPDYAFYDSPLYEVLLPSQGLRRVGANAFDKCLGLASCPIPEGVKVGENVFHYSIQLPLQLDNDNEGIGHFDDLVPVPLSERTDLAATAEVMPSFPGGEQALHDYLAQHMKYPEIAKEMGIEGTVIVQFAVERNGRITTPEVVKSVDRRLDKEAVRLVGQMPTWKPALIDGKPQAMKMTIPVRFKL